MAGFCHLYFYLCIPPSEIAHQEHHFFHTWPQGNPLQPNLQTCHLSFKWLICSFVSLHSCFEYLGRVRVCVCLWNLSFKLRDPKTPSLQDGTFYLVGGLSDRSRQPGSVHAGSVGLWFSSSGDISLDSASTHPDFPFRDDSLLPVWEWSMCCFTNTLPLLVALNFFAFGSFVSFCFNPCFHKVECVSPQSSWAWEKPGVNCLGRNPHRRLVLNPPSYTV